MNALSLDLRSRLLAAFDEGGLTQAALAKRFRVSEATVSRLVALRRATGSVEPKRHGGGTAPRITEADRAGLLAWFEQDPDLSQEEVAERFRPRGRPVSQQTVSRSLGRLSITRKKRP
jgi:transposase